jgi:hypothetical protein
MSISRFDVHNLAEVAVCVNRISMISIIYADGFSKTTNFDINGTGRALLRRPELEDELLKVIYSRERRPFQIVNDHITFL